MIQWTDDLRRGAVSHGSGAPSGDPGPLYAVYLDTATGDVYTHVGGGTWVKIQAVAGEISLEGGVEVDFGTKIDAATIPTGGIGNLGWLSAIWKAVTDRLPAALTGGGGVKTGLVDALPAGTNNIGDVDVLSSALPTGAATAAKQDTLAALVATEASLADVVTAAEAIQAAVEGTVDVNVTNTPAQPLPVVSTSFGHSLQLKATAGYLFGFSVHNKSAGTLYVGLYNAASKTGTVLQYWPVYAGDTTTVTFGDLGLYCGTGIFLQGFTDHDGTNTNAGNELWICGRVI